MIASPGKQGFAIGFLRTQSQIGLDFQIWMMIDFHLAKNLSLFGGVWRGFWKLNHAQPKNHGFLAGCDGVLILLDGFTLG